MLTRTPIAARSRATGKVIPTTPPFDAEYDAWPIWPSNVATDATLTIAPRSPDSSGSVWLIAVAASRMQSNDPIRLIAITFLKASRLAADSYAPSLPTVRCAQPMPAELTSTRQRAHRFRHLDRVDDVVGDGDVDLAERAADLVRQRRSLVLLEVGDDDLRAFGGQGPSGRRTDARRPTSDDCANAFDVHASRR